jgi:hypothetical protein
MWLDSYLGKLYSGDKNLNIVIGIKYGLSGVWILFVGKKTAKAVVGFVCFGQLHPDKSGC